MANTNDVVSARFEAGGLLQITPQGGSILDVKNVAPATLKIKKPMLCAPIVYTDRSALQTPIEGPDMPGSIEFQLRCSKYDATQLMELLTTRKAAPDGNVRLHGIVIKIPSVRGGTVGQSITVAAAYLEEAPTIDTGADFDTVTWKMGINDYAAATY